MKKISILGSTGSIGVSTLEIVAAHPDRFKVVALSAGSNLELLRKQIETFSPQLVAVVSEQSARELGTMLTGKKPEIMHGVPGMIAVATAADSAASRRLSGRFSSRIEGGISADSAGAAAWYDTG